MSHEATTETEWVEPDARLPAWFGWERGPAGQTGSWMASIYNFGGSNSLLLATYYPETGRRRVLGTGNSRGVRGIGRVDLRRGAGGVHPGRRHRARTGHGRDRPRREHFLVGDVPREAELLRGLRRCRVDVDPSTTDSITAKLGIDTTAPSEQRSHFERIHNVDVEEGVLARYLLKPGIPPGDAGPRAAPAARRKQGAQP